MKLALALPMLASLVFSYTPGNPTNGFNPGLGPYYSKIHDLNELKNLDLSKYGLGLGPAVYEDYDSESKKSKSGSLWHDWEPTVMGPGPAVDEKGNLLGTAETTNKVEPIQTEFVGSTGRLMNSANDKGFRCGGYSDGRTPDENEIALYKTVQKTHHFLPNLEDVSNVSVKTQVVAGVNYTYKIPDWGYEVVIYKPLPSSGDATPQLTSVTQNGNPLYPPSNAAPIEN